MPHHIAQHPAALLVLGVAVLFAGGAGPATRPDVPAKPGGAADVRPVVGRTPMAPVGVVRELHGQEWSDAVEARDSADLLSAAYENGRRAVRAKTGDRNPADEAAFARVVAKYRDAIARFPGTEIECYCRIRLAGAYQYRGQFDQTLNEAKQAAERFAGTKLGMDATHAVALTYLQALHEPAQAAVWFNRLQAAAEGIDDESARLKWRAAAAEGLARCEKERGAGKK